jgi:uncharacterized membrane protein
MTKDRLIAFSDGVLAIVITIMVLELKAPRDPSLAALAADAPAFLAYVLSFIYIGIYWNNHHHLFILVSQVRGVVLWANLHLLFWLSLIPFTTSWLGEHPSSAVPAAIYGLSLLMPAIAYYVLQTLLIRDNGRGNSDLAHALGRDLKGKLSPLLPCNGHRALILRALFRRRDLRARGPDVAHSGPPHRAGHSR